MAGGIIGRALHGGGGALEVAGLSILRSELDEKRQVRLQELAHQQQSHLQERGFRHAEGMQRGRLEHDRNSQNARMIFDETMAGARRDFEREQNDANRSLTRDQIAANERIAQANRANAMEIARLGGTVQTDKDGNVLWFGKDGKATPVMDPNNPGQPLKSHADLTPAAKAYADVIKGQLKNLDTLEASPMTDDKTRENINQSRARLNGELLNVLTGGIGKAGQGAQPGAGKTGWDSGSGKVMLNGQEIGTATTEAEARRLVANARKAPSTRAERGNEPDQGAALVEEPPIEMPAVRRGSERRGVIRNILEPEPELLNDE